ncbi:MAG: hypothetical protein IJ728_02585 [Selenomonadaceae bacterium]|nr:hypothetical protein [Selenomonadaceae bacterium]
MKLLDKIKKVELIEGREIMSPIVEEIYNQGKTENMFEMVRNFLNDGTPIEFIKKATGWSEEKINKIIQKSDNKNNEEVI